MDIRLLRKGRSTSLQESIAQADINASAAISGRVSARTR
jgi:hypothetical protein